MLSSEVRRPRPLAGLSLFGSELSVLFRRRRTWAMFIALAAVPILIAVAVRLSSPAAERSGPGVPRPDQPERPLRRAPSPSRSRSRSSSR